MGVPDAEDRESGSDEGNHDPRTITASVELPGGAITRGFGVDEETSALTYVVLGTPFDMGARSSATRLVNEQLATLRFAIERGSQAWGQVTRSDEVYPLKTNDGARPKEGRRFLDEALATFGI